MNAEDLELIRANINKTMAETMKIGAETSKIAAETAKFAQEGRHYAAALFGTIVISGLGAIAAIITTLIKIGFF